VSLIIDCHGHYTVLPKGHDAWREEQKAAFKAGVAAPYPKISDDEIRETIEANQLRLIKERGADLTIFSPRASAMAPHVGDQSVAVPGRGPATI
jgi:4-oxalmesaconate hydratase